MVLLPQIKTPQEMAVVQCIFVVYTLLSMSLDSCRYCINQQGHWIALFPCFKCNICIFTALLNQITPITPTQDLPAGAFDVDSSCSDATAE